MREKRKLRKEKQKISAKKMLKFLMIFIMAFAPIIGIVMISDDIGNFTLTDYFIFITVLSIIEGIIFTIFSLAIYWDSVTKFMRDYYIYHTATVCGVSLILLFVGVVFTILIPYPFNIGFIVFDIIFSVVFLIITPLPFNIITVSLAIILLISFAPETVIPLESKLPVMAVLIIVTLFFGIFSEIARNDWRKKKSN